MEVKDLKPELFWKCFDEVTKIPRPSCHEEQIREFLLKFAAEHGIEAKTDKVGNVVMKRPATPGYENAPVVILQGHMDMVAEKNGDSKHDFMKDPIDTYVVPHLCMVRSRLFSLSTRRSALKVLRILEKT